MGLGGQQKQLEGPQRLLEIPAGEGKRASGSEGYERASEVAGNAWEAFKCWTDPKTKKRRKKSPKSVT